jgi:NAD(P)H-hydrate epimerase
MAAMASLLRVTCSTTGTSPPSTIPSRARTSFTRCVSVNVLVLTVICILANGWRIDNIQQRLKKQLEDLKVPFTEDFTSALNNTDHIIDAIFGFSFSGEVREPFPKVIEALASTTIPVLAVDAPSSWDIEDGPRDDGPGKGFMPPALISLTAPKPLVKWFKGRHFLGGRFLSPAMAEKYGLNIPKYEGLDQVVEVPVESEKLWVMPI